MATFDAFAAEPDVSLVPAECFDAKVEMAAHDTALETPCRRHRTYACVACGGPSFVPGVHRRYCACPHRAQTACVTLASLLSEMVEAYIRGQAKFGATLPPSFFAGSPQQHAILNRHLVDYFKSRARAQESTPYAVPPPQQHLLHPLGMELPQPDAPETPHALHKCIEEFMLRRLRRFLPANNYGIISVKDSKLSLLPPAASVQNPVFEAKDVTRYPGSAVPHASLRDHSVYLMHDVSSEVYPHELVEKLAGENPEAHLFVTGMNPAEVLDRATTFEPCSHTIEYDGDNFNYIFTDSEAEAYSTPIDVTVAWLRTSSVCASNGRVYHVTLLENKLGHCLWHIYCGKAESQHTRTFSTGSMVQIPPALSGTLAGEYLPVKVLSAVLDFVRRTPDLSTRNLAAKVTQAANAVNPKTTSRERWVATHIAGQMAVTKTAGWWVSRAFWNTMYALSFQWHMFRELPDVYAFLDERKRTRTIHPTPGGGWSPAVTWKRQKASIPNRPTMLHRMSAFTGSVFTFLLPKILAGEFVTEVLWRLPLATIVRDIVRWTEFSFARAALTVSIVAVTAILPGHIVKIFSRLAGHFWRQLWFPGWCRHLIETVITELTGAPGYTWFPTLPGRGWLWQLYLWALGAYTVLPGLLPVWVVPWYAMHHPLWAALFFLYFALVLLENWVGAQTEVPFVAPPPPGDADATVGRWWRHWALTAAHSLFVHVALGWQPNLGSCQRLANLPPLPVTPPPTVRRRNVDIVLPPMNVQPAQIPAMPVGVNLALDPLGMDYPDFTDALEQAYQQQPNRYPAFTPGRSCFWDCVEAYGGTGHMWYSWYMARMGLNPTPGEPVGLMTLPEIQVFCAVSGFGLNVSGRCPTVAQAQGQTWPTLHLKLGRGMVNGLLHIELTVPQTVPDGVSALARLLRTIQLAHPPWAAQFQNDFANQPPTFVPRPTAILTTLLGTNPPPESMEEVADAIVASYGARPIQPLPVPQDGFAWNPNAAYQQPWPPLLQYDARVAAQPIGSEPSAKTWLRFRGMLKRVRLPGHYSHPLSHNPPKIGASHSQRRDNAARNNLRPEPPRWVQLRDELLTQVTKFAGLSLPAVGLQEELLSFTADVPRAARLVADLKAHPGVLNGRGDAVVLQSLDAIVDIARLEGRTVSVPVRAYLGVWGSGKTTATMAYLRSLSPEVRATARVVSHTESLRAQAKYKLDFPELRGSNFPTIDTILTEPSSGPVVLDDAGKFWGGVLDLILLTNPLVTEVVVNGDPCQGLSCFPVRGTQSEHDPTAIECIAKEATAYATISHRAFRLLADTFGIHTTNPVAGHITHTVGPKVGIPVCTASPRYVGVLAGSGREAYTYESVQGEDFKVDMEVDMTGLEGAVSDRTGVVALSRSSTGVYLHMDAADPSSTVRKPPSGSDLVNALVYAMRASNGPSLPGADPLVKACFYRHMHWCMPLLPWFAGIGASLDAAVFQSVVPMTNDTTPLDPPPVEQATADAEPSSGAAFEAYVPETHPFAKEFREEATPCGQTDQFKETAFVNPHVHKRGDTPTYFLSVEKRLRTATFRTNYKRMLACPRIDLCNEYDKLVPQPPRWSLETFEGYLDRSIVEYMSKRTAGDVMRKLKASDPDRTGSDIKISLKAQVIAKAEKRGKLKAIPGQLIHEYDALTTLADAAFALWMEDHVFSAFPPQFLFYRRFAPEEFVRAYQARWRVGNGVHTSDVTRWDVGCDAGVLNLDAHIMRRSGFPAKYVDEYVYRRLSSRSQHGPMATMQNSGDRYTWTLNSIRRAILASYVLGVRPDDTLAINGDDEAMDRCAEARPFPDSPWEFKDQNGATGEFSGFELGGPKPVYSASGIHYRAMILESRDPSAQDKWYNYLDLLRHADPDTPEAATTARMAREHMRPELFVEALPVAFRPLFPEVFPPVV